jgi:hypothetical protein
VLQQADSAVEMLLLMGAVLSILMSAAEREITIYLN